jgi:3-isopropylmalate/(R)-2-methylmalate dehydratase small subunit
VSRAWVVGDNLDTDALAPGKYMKFGIEEIAKHCLESLRPEFAATVRPGDLLIGGRNLGTGSSREQAPQALRHLGIAAVVAPSFAGLFYRNALNLGLPALVCVEAARIRDGEAVELDLESARIRLASGEALACEPIPAHLLAMLADGGLLPHLEKRLAQQRQAAQQ